MNNAIPIVDIEEIFPIQHHSGVIHALRYVTKEQVADVMMEYVGLTIAKKDVTFNPKHDTFSDAIETYIKYAFNIAVISDTPTDEPLLISILRASNSICSLSKRGCGNFLIGSRKFLNSDILEQDETKCSVNNIEATPFTSACKIGTFTCLHKDLGNKILVGYVGKKSNDTGIVIGEIDKKFTVTASIFGTQNYYSVIEVK